MPTTVKYPQSSNTSTTSRYQVHSVIKMLIKKAGLTIRDVAMVFNIAPFTLANKLNGYSPLDPDLAERIKSACNKQIAKIKEEQKVKTKIGIQSIADAKAELVRKKREVEAASDYLAKLESEKIDE